MPKISRPRTERPTGLEIAKLWDVDAAEAAESWRGRIFDTGDDGGGA